MNIDSTLDNMPVSQLNLLAKAIIRQLEPSALSYRSFDAPQDFLPYQPLTFSQLPDISKYTTSPADSLESPGVNPPGDLEAYDSKSAYIHDNDYDNEPHHNKHNTEFPIITELIEQLPYENVKSIENSLAAALTAASDNSPLRTDALYNAIPNSGGVPALGYDGSSPALETLNMQTYNSALYNSEYNQTYTSTSDRFLDKGSRMNEMSEFFRRDSRRYDSPFIHY